VVIDASIYAMRREHGASAARSRRAG